MTDTAVTEVMASSVPGWKHESTAAVLSSGESVPFGTMVWSAGLSPVKVTDKLDLKKQGGRVVTDGYLRVRGQEGKVWAIGDCAVMEGMPLPQLAQVAQQQAQYLGPVLEGKAAETAKEFHFFSLGSMASVGGGKGVYDGSHVGDPYGFEAMLPFNLKGLSAWLAWRSAYFGKQVSLANKVRKTRVSARSQASSWQICVQ